MLEYWRRFQPGQGRELCLGDLIKNSGLGRGGSSCSSSGFESWFIEEEFKFRDFNNDQVLIAINRDRETKSYTVALVLYKYNDVFDKRFAKEDTIKNYAFTADDENPYKAILSDIYGLLGMEQ